MLPHPPNKKLTVEPEKETRAWIDIVKKADEINEKNYASVVSQYSQKDIIESSDIIINLIKENKEEFKEGIFLCGFK